MIREVYGYGGQSPSVPFGWGGARIIELLAAPNPRDLTDEPIVASFTTQSLRRGDDLSGDGLS